MSKQLNTAGRRRSSSVESNRSSLQSDIPAGYLNYVPPGDSSDIPIFYSDSSSSLSDDQLPTVAEASSNVEESKPSIHSAVPSQSETTRQSNRSISSVPLEPPLIKSPLSVKSSLASLTTLLTKTKAPSSSTSSQSTLKPDENENAESGDEDNKSLTWQSIASSATLAEQDQLQMEQQEAFFDHQVEEAVNRRLGRDESTVYSSSSSNQDVKRTRSRMTYETADTDTVSSDSFPTKSDIGRSYSGSSVTTTDSVQRKREYWDNVIDHELDVHFGTYVEPIAEEVHVDTKASARLEMVEEGDDPVPEYLVRQLARQHKMEALESPDLFKAMEELSDDDAEDTDEEIADKDFEIELDDARYFPASDLREHPSP